MNEDTTMSMTTMTNARNDEHIAVREPKPYVRIVVDEVQWPLLLDAIRSKEFALREELRRTDPDDATAVTSVRARIRAIGRSRKLLISCVRERGWLQ